jgi:hypothetical protein
MSSPPEMDMPPKSLSSELEPKSWPPEMDEAPPMSLLSETPRPMSWVALGRVASWPMSRELEPKCWSFQSWPAEEDEMPWFQLWPPETLLPWSS